MTGDAKNNRQTYDEGVPLSSENLDLIYSQRLVVDSVDLDNCHIVVVDAELPVGIARNRDKTEPVAMWYDECQQ